MIVGNPRRTDHKLPRLFAGIVGGSGILLTLMWALLAMVSSMGWSGRSDLQIALIIVLLLISPIFIAATLTERAVKAASRGEKTKAILQAFGSLLCAPVSWGLLAAGLFAP